VIGSQETSPFWTHCKICKSHKVGRKTPGPVASQVSTCSYQQSVESCGLVLAGQESKEGAEGWAQSCGCPGGSYL
jgi:hypothetical protein